MKLLDLKLDPADVGGPGPYGLLVRISVTGSNIDPAHPPGVFGLRLLPGAPGQGAASRQVTADLAIGDVSLIPGRVRGSNKPSLVPFVEVKNLGDDIPAPLVGQVTLTTGYFIGQYGDSLNDAQETVWCINGLGLTGPFKAGTSVYITPTHAQKLPTGVFTTWTKLFGVRTCVRVDPNGSIVDPNLANNDYTKLDGPPIVLGDGPGPYEVIFYDQQNFQGAQTSYEGNPKLRQRLYPDLGAWNNRVRSMKIGEKVKAALFTDPNFVNGWDRSSTGYFRRHIFAPVAGGWTSFYQIWPDSLAGEMTDWFTRSHDRAVRSLIVFPVTEKAPTGLLLVDTSVWFWDTTGFFPLPEDPKVFQAKFADLGPLNGCANRMQAFGAAFDMTMYEGTNFSPGAWNGHADPQYKDFKLGGNLGAEDWACSLEILQTGHDWQP
jgi:hypothetical protein